MARWIRQWDHRQVHVGETYVLHAVIAWQVSPVQNSEMVLYCRLIRLKNVVAVEKKREELLSVRFSSHKGDTANTSAIKHEHHESTNGGRRYTYNTGQCSESVTMMRMRNSHTWNTNPSGHCILQNNVLSWAKTKLKTQEAPATKVLLMSVNWNKYFYYTIFFKM